MRNLIARLFGRRGASHAPAGPGRDVSGLETPEATVVTLFAAMQAHDLHAILRTLAPERARLYQDPRTLDKRRLTIARAEVISAEPAAEPVPFPSFAERYAERIALKVEFELNLVDSEQRRDPTLGEGRQWSYYALVQEGAGGPWLIADWGR